MVPVDYAENDMEVDLVLVGVELVLDVVEWAIWRGTVLVSGKLDRLRCRHPEVGIR